MDQKSCTACAGMGYEIVARGSGLDWDTRSICVTCGGTGSVTDYDAIRQREREESRRREEAKKAAKAATSSASANQRSSSTKQDWSWLAAIVTFIAGVVVANEQLQVEGWPSLVGAVFFALIAGRYYKPIIGFAVLGGLVWFFLIKPHQ